MLCSPMEIVAVDRSLLQLATVDEDESEAVALSCVEFLLSETNAYYQQRCLASEAVRAVSSRLRDNVIDTVFAAALDAEAAVDETRFRPESRPEAKPKDRHAVRSVPCKSPEKPVSMRSALPIRTSSSPASHVGSIADKARSRVGGPTRRKKKADQVDTDKTSTTPIQTIEREDDQDDEKPETKEWREKCLKSLEAASRKPGFAKWVNLARAFAVPESRVSMEVGVIAAPPASVVAALAATPVRMKTNVDSFSSILDVNKEGEGIPTANDDSNVVSTLGTRRTSRRPSAVLESTGRSLQPMSTTIHTIEENPQRQSKRRSQAAIVSDSIPQQRKATLLTDSLSRRKLTRHPSSSESLSGNSNGGWNSSRSLWRYEQETGSATSRTFVADGAEFNASSLTATMSVASGVVLLQGESVVEGPEWVDGASTMSRKRFDLQQRLATDALLNSTSESDLNSPRASSAASPLQFGHYPASPLSELHFRDYEEVPPEPIPMPQLSPISTSALAIPRTHLNASLSTPSLRVRPAAFSGKAGGSLKGETSGSNRSVCTNISSTSGHASLASFKSRPTTALRAVAAPPKLLSGRARSASATPGNARSSTQMKSAGTASAKYLREFPKPREGVIRVVNDHAAGLLGSIDGGQRTAWMS